MRLSGFIGLARPRWPAVLAMLAAVGLEGAVQPAAAGEEAIECGSRRLLVDLTGLDATCKAGTISGRTAGDRGNSWTARYEMLEAKSEGVHLVVIGMHAGHYSLVGASWRTEFLLATPQDSFGPRFEWATFANSAISRFAVSRAC